MGGAYTKPELQTKWFPKVAASVPDLSGRVFVITGTTTGTGKVVAEEVAKKGAEVFLLNRSSSRSDKALAELKEAVPDAAFHQVECDLQDFDSVRSAAEAVKSSASKVNVIVLNAGIMATADAATKQGYDTQMQTNVLSHFLLARELYPLVEKGAEQDGEARIVNHSSVARFGKNLEAKYLEKNGGNLGGNSSGMLTGGARWVRYQQTKLGCLVFTCALADKLEAAGKSNIKSVCAHPGLSATNLQVTTNKDGGMGSFLANFIMKRGQSAEDGAAGLLRASAGPDVVQYGFYGPGAGRMALKGFPNLIPVKKEKANNQKNKNLFWTKCEEACGEFKI